MAVQEQRTLPAKFVEDLGVDLAKQITAQTGVPIVTGGIGSISQQAGETAEGFKARQDAARAFTTRQQSLAGLAPQIAGQDPLQAQAQKVAQAGIGSFQPFLNQAQTAGTAAGTALSGIQLGAPTTQQVQDFMSPYQSQVIDATLSEFDRNTQMQQQSIRDQQAALGALGSGRAGVQLAEFGTGAARERALLQAGLLQQGFGQAQQARQQDIANRFGVAQGQQGLGGFQAGLGAQQQALTGGDVRQLGTLGALNQAQAQAGLDAQREATRMAAFQPQEQLDRYAGQVTGLLGGYPAQFQQSVTPNPTPLQTALGVGTTLAGIYGAVNPRPIFAEGGEAKEGIMQVAEIDMLKEEYEKYKYDLLEQRPDAMPMSFEEFRRMVLSGQG
jgi:uncharacterized short protein YbdD (DUF466 family)